MTSNKIYLGISITHELHHKGSLSHERLLQ